MSDATHVCGLCGFATNDNRELLDHLHRLNQETREWEVIPAAPMQADLGVPVYRGDCRWLLGAFAHYAIHDTPCDFAKNEMRPCSCGLDEIMAAVLTEIEAEDDATESAT